MKSNSAKSNLINDSSRCSHSTSRGHRCRMLAAPESRFCAHHWQHARLDAAALAAELSQPAGSLNSPEDVNRVLAKIFLALAEDRIPTRKAAVLGYLGQMLLRSHREIVFDQKLAAETEAANTPRLKLSRYVPRGYPSESAGSLASSSAPSRDVATAPQPQATPPAAQTEAPPSTPPTPPPAPAKLPDLSHFYPNDPTLHPSFNAYRNTYVPYEPPPPSEEQRCGQVIHRRRFR